MLKRTHALVIALLVFLAGVATGWALRPSSQQPTAHDGWLSGSVDEKFTTVERHLRGLDQTMAEIGYRFSELYWAGKDRNWVYARYQLDKIETTLKLGVERRPKRAASATPFLDEEIPDMRQAIEREDDVAFQGGIARLRSACMSCNVQENVQWLVIEMPEHRLSPIRFIP